MLRLLHRGRRERPSGCRASYSEDFHEYADRDDLVRRLTSNIDPEPLQFSVKLDHRAPVYLVEPPVKGLAVTAMIARLKKARYRYRSFIPGEDVRLSAVDAIRQVASSSGVLVTIEEPTKPPNRGRLCSAPRPRFRSARGGERSLRYR
jgi:hypothetical protein